MRKILKYSKRKVKQAVLLGQCAFSKETCYIAPEVARRELQEYAPMPTSSAVTEYREFGDTYDLAIIIPAYNASKWIRECLNSIFHQDTKYSLQVIVVNDGSTDDTGSILKEYEYKSGITIITQENKGYSGARNVAIREVKSKYLMFVDSDDYLLPGAIQILMDVAHQEDATIVEGNGCTFNENGRIGKIKQFDDAEHLWGGPCLKVMRSSLFSRVEFPEDYLYEDTIICALIKPQAPRIVVIPNEVYAYRIHQASITQRKDENPKRVDSLWIMIRMIEDQEKLGIADHSWLLRHIVITNNRTRFLPERIKQCIFNMFYDVVLLQEETSADLDFRDKQIRRAILNRQYRKFQLLCQS